MLQRVTSRRGAETAQTRAAVAAFRGTVTPSLGCANMDVGMDSREISVMSVSTLTIMFVQCSGEDDDELMLNVLRRHLTY